MKKKNKKSKPHKECFKIQIDGGKDINNLISRDYLIDDCDYDYINDKFADKLNLNEFTIESMTNEEIKEIYLVEEKKDQTLNSQEQKNQIIRNIDSNLKENDLENDFVEKINEVEIIIENDIEKDKENVIENDKENYKENDKENYTNLNNEAKKTLEDKTQTYPYEHTLEKDKDNKDIDNKDKINIVNEEDQNNYNDFDELSEEEQDEIKEESKEEINKINNNINNNQEDDEIINLFSIINTTNSKNKKKNLEQFPLTEKIAVDIVKIQETIDLDYNRKNGGRKPLRFSNVRIIYQYPAEDDNTIGVFCQSQKPPGAKSKIKDKEKKGKNKGGRDKEYNRKEDYCESIVPMSSEVENIKKKDKKKNIISNDEVINDSKKKKKKK